MTTPASPTAPAAARPAWQQQLSRVAIGLAGAALLFFLGWMMGRGPVDQLERERDEARARQAVLAAEAAAYRSAVALEARNFGTANDRLRAAAAALAAIPEDDEVPGLGEDDVAALNEVRAALSRTDLNVAVDVEAQRAEVLRLAGRLDAIAAAWAGTAPATLPAGPAPGSDTATDTLR
jgi:hypothetical protein